MHLVQRRTNLSCTISKTLNFIKYSQFSNAKTLDKFIDRFRTLRYEESDKQITYNQFQDEIITSYKHWDFSSINYSQIRSLSNILKIYKANNVAVLFSLQKEFTKSLPQRKSQSFSDSLSIVQLLSPDNIADSNFLRQSFEFLAERYREETHKNERKLGNFAWYYAYFNLPDPKTTQFISDALYELFPTTNTVNNRIEAIHLAKIAFYLSYEKSLSRDMHENLLSRIENQIEQDRIGFYRTLNTPQYLGYLWTWFHSIELNDQEIYLRYKDSVCKKIPFQLSNNSFKLTRQQEFGKFLSSYFKNARIKQEEQLGVYKVDFFIEDKNAVIEYNGKGHYINFSERETGRHLIRARNLKDAGYKLVDIPYYEWNGLTTLEEKTEYLNKKFVAANIVL